jgi:hypothetical protein
LAAGRFALKFAECLLVVAALCGDFGVEVRKVRPAVGAASLALKSGGGVLWRVSGRGW